MIARKVLCGEFDGTNGRIRTIGGNYVEYASDGTMKLIWHMDNNIQYRSDGRLSVLFGNSVFYHSDREIGRVGNAIVTYNADGTINNIGGIRFEYHGDPYLPIKARPRYESVFKSQPQPQPKECRDPIPVFNKDETITLDFSCLHKQPLDAAEQKENEMRRFVMSRLMLAGSLSDKNWHSLTSLCAGTPEGFKKMLGLIRQYPALNAGELVEGFQKIARTRCGPKVVRSFFPDGTRDPTLRSIYAAISTAASLNEIRNILDKELKKIRDKKNGFDSESRFILAV